MRSIKLAGSYAFAKSPCGRMPFGRLSSSSRRLRLDVYPSSCQVRVKVSPGARYSWEALRLRLGAASFSSGSVMGVGAAVRVGVTVGVGGGRVRTAVGWGKVMTAVGMAVGDASGGWRRGLGCWRRSGNGRAGGGQLFRRGERGRGFGQGGNGRGNWRADGGWGDLRGYGRGYVSGRLERDDEGEQDQEANDAVGTQTELPPPVASKICCNTVHCHTLPDEQVRQLFCNPPYYLYKISQGLSIEF